MCGLQANSPKSSRMPPPHLRRREYTSSLPSAEATTESGTSLPSLNSVEFDAALQAHIRFVVQQEVQHELADIRDKMSKFDVDLQVLEVCAMSQQNGASTKVPPISGFLSAEGARCEARLNKIDEKIKELVNAQRNAARIGSDFRNQLENVVKRQARLQSCITSKAWPLASRLERDMSTVAMPLVRTGGDIGPSLMTGRTEADTDRASSRRSKWFEKRVPVVPAWPAWSTVDPEPIVYDYAAAQRELEAQSEEVRKQFDALQNPIVGHDGKLIEQVD